MWDEQTTCLRPSFIKKVPMIRVKGSAGEAVCPRPRSGAEGLKKSSPPTRNRHRWRGIFRHLLVFRHSVSPPGAISVAAFERNICNLEKLRCVASTGRQSEILL